MTPPFLNTIFTDIVDQSMLQSTFEFTIQLADQFDREFVVLWKTDLKATVNLIKSRPGHTHLITSHTMFNLSVVWIMGNFGWTGMPFKYYLEPL